MVRKARKDSKGRYMTAEEVHSVSVVLDGIAALRLGTSVTTIRSRERKARESEARGIVWTILHYEYGASITQIASEYGRTTRAITQQIAKTKYQAETSRESNSKYHDIREPATALD